MDPYRLFFPLGALAAILGTLPWVLFGFGFSGFYPGLFHPDLMIGGFLFAFSAGFLMTAVPQFTGSTNCRKWELLSGGALFLALLAASFLDSRAWFHFLSFSSLLYLVFFCGQRVLTRTYEPPRFFVFVGLGLLMGISGALTLALGDLGWISSASFLGMAKLIYTQGMILSLILGVGTHLLPAIWGWTDLPVQITKVNELANPLKFFGPVIALAALLLGSFLIEVESSQQVGWGMRAALVTYLAVRHWRILRKPKARGKVAFWLWISAWALLIGLWAPVFSPDYWVHSLHIAFIGGFGLMTFMVASRVTLAHGGYGHRVDLRSRLLTTSAVLMLVAALTRAVAPLVPQAYLHHLAYAAGIWVLAIVLWSAVFVSKMIWIKA
ncbi:MAG: NnrS family protein [Bdellovibrionota bacterium]